MLALFKHSRLILALTKREIQARYRGSILGLLWSLLSPAILLCVYTFVFSEVFNARWGSEGGSRVEFAIVLFVGLMIYNFFAECINTAPNLIVQNVNYVKKVVFPLEILPVVSLLSALFNFTINLTLWSIVSVFLFQTPPLTALWLPFIMLPLGLFTLGLSWFFASTGVYIRDLSQAIGPFMTALLFMSPIFYPVSNLPDHFQKILLLNPLTTVIENARGVLISGIAPNLGFILTTTLLSTLVAWLGFFWFKQTKSGFSDVL